ncbi:acyltransferase [Burkholderia sp.]|uniref:acyltransferase family protein n=1 Tax=Burkholderia sp. TaxID=36773 RepID=UPI00258FE7C9|nr:acyltransferase [Burkholderia sp.]
MTTHQNNTGAQARTPLPRDFNMPSDVPYLNGLRGIAATWVVIAHCMIWGGWTLTAIPDPKIAVDLFMTISGFLMAYNARRRESIEPMTHPATWTRFYIRRYFRIAPAYYLSLAFAVLASAPFLDGYKALQLMNPGFWGSGGIYDPDTIRFTAANLLAHVTFVFGAVPKYTFATMLPDWSLSLEMQFYLAFPLLYLLMRKIGPLTASIGLAALALAACHALAGVFPEPGFLPLKLSLFVTGMLIAEIPFGTDKTVTILIGVLAVLLPFAQTSSYAAQAWLLPVIAASLYALTVNRKPVSSLLQPVANRLGGRHAHALSDASYGMYLFHGFFIALTGLVLSGAFPRLAAHGNIRTIVLLAVALPGSLLVSTLIHRFVEQPGIELGRNAANLLSQRASGSR